MGYQAVRNFKFNSKHLLIGDLVPANGADGKPFASEKDLAMLVREGHILDQSKVTAVAYDDLSKKIALKQAELSALEKALAEKKGAAPKV